MENSDLKTAFDAVFTASSHPRSWNTARGRWHWLQAEGWKDAIAGPLWSIVNDGGCGYVYPRQDSAFAGVHDPSSLRNRLLEWYAKLASHVETFTPASADERRDQRFMQSLLPRIRAVIERGLEIESQRWQTTRKPSA